MGTRWALEPIHFNATTNRSLPDPDRLIPRFVAAVIHEFPPILNCWYLTGATASGKSGISRMLAGALNAEIVSMDSMAVYRGMDIGTAKPTNDELAEVPHHLIDVIDPNEEFSLAEFLTLSHQAVAAIHQRGKQVLFVGGTPLYLKSLLRGVCEGPPANEDFRREVEKEVESVGVEALRQRLEQVDPLSAAKLHPNDKRRMIRALEVYTLTGTPISHYQLQFEGKHSDRCKRVFVVSRKRDELHTRINERTEKMFESGLVEEVKALQAKHGTFSKTSLQGVGYSESLNHLEEKCDIAEAVELTKIRTRRFARRQETWFRGLDECQWLPVDAKTSKSQLVDLILSPQEKQELE